MTLPEIHEELHMVTGVETHHLLRDNHLFGAIFQGALEFGDNERISEIINVFNSVNILREMYLGENWHMLNLPKVPHRTKLNKS